MPCLSHIQNVADRPGTISLTERAAARLALLAKTGRSPSEIVEEALENMPDPPEILEYAEESLEERLARLEEIIDRIAAKPRRFKTMEEFDRHEYDERGLPR